MKRQPDHPVARQRPAIRESPDLRPTTFVLSIKPTYIERILEGRKTIELRRRFPRARAPACVLLYSTSPVQALVGHAVLRDVAHLSVQALWLRFSRAAGVTRTEFDRYFYGVKSGCALRLTDIQVFADPMALKELEDRFAFSPPQSYCYGTKLAALIPHGWAEAAP